MKKKSLTIFDAGVAFLMSFILAQFTSAIGIAITEFILQAMGKTDTQITAFFDTAVGYLLQAIFMNLAFVAIFIWYFKRINKHEVFTKPNKATWQYVLKCIAIGVATMFLLAGTLNYFQLFVNKLGFESSSMPYSLNSTANYLISLISLAVFPAICEELLFRGVLANALKHKGQIFAVVLSSVMFAIFHFSPSQLIYPMCFGLILSIVYLRTNNLLFPILLHFINNALNLSIQYFSSSSGGEFTHSGSMLMYALITLAIWIGLIIYLFKDFKLHSSSQISSNENIDQQVSQTTNTQPQTNINNSLNTLTNTNSNNDANDKLNKLVFYGSIAIMTCIYIMLLTV